MNNLSRIFHSVIERTDDNGIINTCRFLKDKSVLLEARLQEERTTRDELQELYDESGDGDTFHELTQTQARVGGIELAINTLTGD